MTPVTGRVTDGEKDWFAFVFGSLQRFVTPGVPIDWIVLMLQEVWTGFVSQLVGHVEVALYL